MFDTIGNMNSAQIDWFEWKPGDSSSADYIRSLGVSVIRDIASSLDVPIDQLPSADQESIVNRLAECLDTGQSIDWLAKKIRPYIESKSDADSTANTLLAWAMSVTSIGVYVESGTKTKWLAEDDSCPSCRANEAQGPISPRSTFPSGHFAPPAHRDCRCCLVPHLDPPLKVRR